MTTHKNMDLFSLEGKIALITGSSRGIGRQMAKGLAEAGALVVINGINPKNIDSAVEELTKAGLKATGKAFDVTDSAEIETTIADIENETGPIDILVNNAGIQRRTPLLDCTDEIWREVMETNLESVFKVRPSRGEKHGGTRARQNH